jgi:hypothetical protein
MFFHQAITRLQQLNILCLTSALAACGSPSAPSSQPTVARQAAVSSDTTSLIALSPQDSIIVAGPSPTQEGDIPELHRLAIDDNTTVGPGLVVSYQSIPQPATAIVHDPHDLPLSFSIRRSGEIIFRDTTDGYSHDPTLVDSAIRKVYPLWIPTGKDAGELLVLFNNRPSRDLVRRFSIRGRRVTKIDTLLTFDGPARDVDGDGKREFSGIQDYGEVWDDEQGRRRGAYNPTLYYEVRPTGLVLDSMLTRRKARAQYGKFYGFKYSHKPVILVK